MTTLKDRLLNGKVIGETFRICSSGAIPGLFTYDYTVKNLESGSSRGLDSLYLVVEGQDKQEFYFELAHRLTDEQAPSQESEQRSQQPIPTKKLINMLEGRRLNLHLPRNSD